MINSSVGAPSRALYVTTSWDDGSIHDLRLSDLLLRYGVCGTFYISKTLVRRGISDRQVQDLGRYFEIGGHGIQHLKLDRLSEHDAKEEVFGSKAYVEDVTGRRVTSFAYPYGSYNEATLYLLGEAGFTVGRTTKAFSEPLVDAPLAQGVTLQVVPYRRASTEGDLRRIRRSRLPKLIRLEALGVDSGDICNWRELALMSFEAVRSIGGLWHLWGHSWEIEECGLWDDLERVLSRIRDHSSASFVPNCEIPSIRTGPEEA